MRCLLLTFLTCYTHLVSAQVITPDDAAYFTDLNAKVLCNTAGGTYTYPGFYFEGRWLMQEPGVPYTEVADTFILTPTSTAWLLHQYHIYPDTLQGDCMYMSWWFDYDSLMYNAITRRYGPDFFSLAQREADSLSAAGAGIREAFIRDPAATPDTLNKAYGYFLKRLDTMQAHNPVTGLNKPTLLRFNFKNGRVASVELFNYGFGLSRNNSFAALEPKMLKTAQRLHWTPPMFLRKPLDGHFDWHLERGRQR